MNISTPQQSPSQATFPLHENKSSHSPSPRHQRPAHPVPHPQRQLPSLPGMASFRPPPPVATNPFQPHYPQSAFIQGHLIHTGPPAQAGAVLAPYATPQMSAQHQEQIPPTPPSPTESEGPESEEPFRRSLPDAAVDVRVVEGKRYRLEIVQQPIRARMCGYGDKDRRPISTAPIVKATIEDPATGQEIDYKSTNLEISHLVCYAHMYDKTGVVDKSTLRNSMHTMNIHSSENTAYPPAVINGHPEFRATRVASTDATSSHTPHVPTMTERSTVHPQGAKGPFIATHLAGPSMYPNVSGPPDPAAQQPYNHYRPAPSPYGNEPPASSQAVPQTYHTGPIQPLTPPPIRDEEGAPDSKHLSQNLIGNNVQSGQLLEDIDGKQGIFFIFADLSVRNEGWFRLKFTLFNMGLPLERISPEERFRLCDSINSAPTSGPNVEAARTGTKRLEGMFAGLLTRTAPCVASVFTQGFKVYSAKKFPGVAEGTPLMKKFADQGAKISVRKDASKEGGKRKRSETKDDSGDSDGDDD